MPLGWRALVKLLLAFALWSGVGLHLLPRYALIVLPATSGVLQALRPHDLDLTLVDESPYLSWHF